MALHSGYQIASRLHTMIKSSTGRRSAVLIVLTQGPLVVKQIITRSLKSVLTLSLHFEPYVTSFEALHPQDLKGFAPQRLGKDILCRVTVIPSL